MSLRTPLLLALLSICARVEAKDAPEAPLGRVSDFSHQLTAAEVARLDDELRAYPAGAPQRIYVAVFSSLEGDSLEAFSMRLAERWKVGNKAANDGVLVSIFLAEHKLRIEVGYGEEGSLTDASSGHIIHDVMAPLLRDHRTADAISAGAAAIRDLEVPPVETAVASPKKPEPRLDQLPWRRAGHHDRLDLRTDLRVFDLTDSLTASEWADVEHTIRDLEREDDVRFVVVILDHHSLEADAICDEVGAHFQLQTGRLVRFCSYLDSDMVTSESPALGDKLSDADFSKIVAERMAPFYGNGRVAAGLEQGLYGVDERLSGRKHPFTLTAPDAVPADLPFIHPVIVPQAPSRPFYVSDLIDDELYARLQQSTMAWRFVFYALSDLVVIALMVAPLSIMLVVLVLGLRRVAITKARAAGKAITWPSIRNALFMWLPFCVVALWTFELAWMLFALFVVVTILVTQLTPMLDGIMSRRSSDSGSSAWTSSSSGWSSSSSSSSSSSDFGGSFGGGGASGDW